MATGFQPNTDKKMGVGSLVDQVSQAGRNIGEYWSGSNAQFEAGNPSTLARVGRSVNPVTGFGSALGAMHDGASKGSTTDMGIAAAQAIPLFAVAGKVKQVVGPMLATVANTGKTASRAATGTAASVAADEVQAMRPGLRNGGELKTGHGGHVPGAGKGDKIPAKYEPGEFVVSNAMLAKNPGLREQLHSLRADALADKGMTPEQADAKAVSPRGFIRAMTGYSENDPGSRLGVQTAAQELDNRVRVASGPMNGATTSPGATNQMPADLRAMNQPGVDARNAQYAERMKFIDADPERVKARTQAAFDQRWAQGGPARAAAAEAAHGERVNPSRAASIGHGDGRYGAPASPPLNSEFIGPRPGQATQGPIIGRAREILNRAGPGLQEFTGASGQPSALGGRIAQGVKGFANGAAKLAGRVAAPLAVGMEGYDVARVAADPNASKIDVATQVAQGSGRLGAAGAGAGAGAAIGTAVFPGAGTVLGGLAGGALGYYGANKAIEAGRTMAGVDTSAPADRAPGFFDGAGTSQPAGTSTAGAGRGTVNPTQADVTAAQASKPAAVPTPAPTNPNQITATRQPNGTMSFSGGPNIGKDGGDISYTGAAGFKPSGAGVTVVPGGSFANGSPAVDTALSAARMAAADRGDFGAVRDSYFAQGQGFGGQTRDSVAADRLREIALSPQGTPGRKAALQMLSDQTAATTTRQAQQAANDIARQELDLKKTASGFTARAAARIESLQAAFDAAKPEDRPAIAEQLRVLTGKDKPDQFAVASGGQQVDANGMPYKTPDRVFNKSTGLFSDQGAPQAAKPAVQEGSVSEVNGKKAKFTKGQWVPF